MREFRGQSQGDIGGGPKACCLSSGAAGKQRDIIRLGKGDWANWATVDSGRYSTDEESPVKARIAAAHCLPADIRLPFRISRNRWRRDLGPWTRNKCSFRIDVHDCILLTF